MKILAVTLIILGGFFTRPAYCETWYEVSSSKDGTAMLVDVDSFKIKDYDERQSQYSKINTKMKGTDFVVTAMIDNEECKTQLKGTMHLIGFVEGKAQHEIIEWDFNDDKLIDFVGKFMCTAIFRLENSNK